MMSASLWLKPDAVFDGSDIKTGYLLQIDNWCVRQIVLEQDMSKNKTALPLSCVVSPGFVDLQVNGGGGFLLNENPSAKVMLEILRNHRCFGISAIMPTLITDAPETLAKAVDAAIEVKDTSGLLGLHIEGPHIAVERRGAHEEKFVRAFAENTFELVEKLRSFVIPVIITLAPEVVDGSVISRLAAKGAIVSLGHRNADVTQTQAALKQSARAFTHLFNAMPPMLTRASGIVAAAINSDAYTGIIGDGLHVHDEMIKLAIRVRLVPDRIFIVSDSMPSVGGPEEFDLYGRTVALQNGQMVNSEGSLAGAHITMPQTVSRFINHLSIAPAQALKMATSVPAGLINNLQAGQIQSRDLAELVALDNDFSYLDNMVDYLKKAIAFLN